MLKIPITLIVTNQDNTYKVELLLSLTKNLQKIIKTKQGRYYAKNNYR